MGQVITEMDDEQKKVVIENIQINYPRQNKIVEEIQKCRMKSKYSREPHCMFIYGRPGVGKSTIVDNYVNLCRQELEENPEMKHLPVLTINASLQATTKSLVSKMLYALGDPACEKGTKQAMSHRLEVLLRKKGIEIILLDEFQRFIDSHSLRVLKDVAETLTIIMNNTKIPMVLVGLPAAKEIFHSEEYLARRCMLHREVTPFQWDTEENRKELITFLSFVNDSLPFKNMSPFHTEDMAFRIYYASDGIAHYIMKLIKGAAERAIDVKTQDISSAFFSDVFEDELKTVFRHKVNPFLCGLKRLETELKKQQAGISVKGKKETSQNIRTLLQA